MNIFVRIGVAASMMGVSTKTSRRRDAAGTTTCYRTVRVGSNSDEKGSDVQDRSCLK
ncbi:MAG: hypothetical protein ACTSUE_21435 [Promethearchaeota archaeon]